MKMGTIFGGGGTPNGQAAMVAAERQTQAALHNASMMADYQRTIQGAALQQHEQRSLYAAFSMRVEECTGGFVVHIGAARHIIRDLTEIGPLAATHFATLALERP